MGTYVDLYKIKYSDLIFGLIDKYQIEDTNDKKIEEILLQFGEVIGGYYILLNNEHYEDSNSYYGVIYYLDTYFQKDGAHDVILDLKEEMVCNMAVYEVEEALGDELPEEEDE